MENLNFHSNLSVYLYSYLEPRFVKGKVPGTIINSLKSLDNFLISINHSTDSLSMSDYDRWSSTLNNLKPMSRYIYICSVINFLKFLSKIGHECYIPMRPKCPQREFIPYIFTKTEIDSIFKAVDNMRVRPKRGSCTLMAMPAIIRLLYSTGIRVGEALKLRNRNLDLQHHVVILEDTKNNNQRIAPINHTLEVVLKDYFKFRNKMPIDGLEFPDSYMFVSHRGNPINHQNVYDAFVKVLEQANITRKSNHEGPNIHSIRHTACMHALQQLISEGMDMYCCLPILSVFMGHKCIYDTESYIHLTSELFPELLEKTTTLDADFSRIIAKAIL